MIWMEEVWVFIFVDLLIIVFGGLFSVLTGYISDEEELADQLSVAKSPLSFILNFGPSLAECQASIPKIRMNRVF
jgi:hypothetical protein